MNALVDKYTERMVKGTATFRALMEKAEKENRELTSIEREEADKAIKDVEEAKVAKDTVLRGMKIDEELRGSAGTSGSRTTMEDPGSKLPGGERRGVDRSLFASKEMVEQRFRVLARLFSDPEKRKLKKEEREIMLTPEDQLIAFRNYLVYGERGLSERDRGALAEARALQADADTAGGFLVVPQEFLAQLIIFVKNAVYVRAKATVIPMMKAETLGVPSLDTDFDDADWTSELNIGGESTSMAIGKRELKPHPLAKFIKVSNKLLRVAALDPEGLVIDRMGYKFAVTEEKAFLLGSGAGQPLGIFTASANGIDTSRDVSAGNTTTAIGADGLIATKYGLKPQYWPKAEWTFHRDAVKQVAQLKDGQGAYLWQPSMIYGLQPGQPDRLLGFPVNLSEYAPNTFTTGLYVGILGDMSKYWIVDALAMTVQRLVELYAGSNETGFLGRRELDGAPVLAEAFSRVKLA